ncbi:DUF3131 domain-containing protein [Photobacterium rosenbergii]|uniref:DUF3131 domain-containing protein n=1 Tax=Photobacterium rosenbergii TaxID=294936 RepID=UPI001C99E1D7|nr:DUF3131 domain-containing protein [Photobacterium rosenbergii]MBY5944019.1 DUF3131 domain-containing protein [Photobacterium rosenbergii]
MPKAALEIEKAEWKKALRTALCSSLLIPFSVLAAFNTETEEPEPSFYGGRSVTHNNQGVSNSDIQFQRRTIAPPIIADEQPGKVEQETDTIVVSENSVDTPSTKRLAPIALSRNESLLAKKAYYYFEQNWNEETGLINSVQGYHHSTMWDVASGIAAILSAEGLELMTTEEADNKLQKTLDTLGNLPLYDNALPNREYNTHTAKPSGRYSNSSSNGNGWSALDIGRLLIWLEIAQAHKPQLVPNIKRILDKWDLDKAVSQGTLYGELKTSQKRHYRQEGRLGYLQYAASGFDLFGFDVNTAYKQEDIGEVTVDGIQLLIDKRNLPYFTTDPYVLYAIEIGPTTQWWNQLDALFQLQKKKSTAESNFWVFAEDAMSRSPWFSYNNIFIYGSPWLSIAPGGKPVENPQIFSNKVAFGLSVLFEGDDFSQQLAEKVINSSLTHRVVPTGMYLNGGPNSAYNINTNSLILSALWYKRRHFQPLINPS